MQQADEESLDVQPPDGEPAKNAELAAALAAPGSDASRTVVRRGKYQHKPRCGACGHALYVMDSWTCSHCQADLREVGCPVPLTWSKLVSGALAMLWRRLWRRERAGCGCGACGYSARGLASFDCPECGADLRRTGVVDRDRVPVAVAALAACAGWLVLFAVVAGLLFQPVQERLVTGRIHRSDSLLLASPSHGYEIVLRGYGDGEGALWTGLPSHEEIGIVLRLPRINELWNSSPAVPGSRTTLTGDRFAAMAIDPRSGYHSCALQGSYIAEVGSTKFVGEGNTFNRASVAMLLTAAGLDTSEPDVADQVDELSRIVLAVNDGTFDPGSISHYRAIYKPSVEYEAITKWRNLHIALWGVLAIGTTWLVRRLVYRRFIRRG